MTRPGQLWPPDDRPDLGAYTVAFSFAGERIEVVRPIAEAVEAALLPGEVFFDEYFEPVVRQGHTRDRLDNIYRNRSALVVRFLCTDYRDKTWTQGESIAIASRDLDSVLDLQATDVPIDGLAGARSFPFKAHKEADECVQQILALVRKIISNTSKNKNEIRTPITVFEALALIDLLKIATIPKELLFVAVRNADLKWPSPDRAAHFQLSWWINICRGFTDHQRRLTNLLHGVWPAIKECEEELKGWFLKFYGVDFERPKKTQIARPVMQITRKNLGTKENPCVRLNFDLVHGSERQSNDDLECKLVELPNKFPAEFEKLSKIAQTTEARVELVLPLNELHGGMQSLRIFYGSVLEGGQRQYSTLCLRFSTVVRMSLRKPDASTHAHWQTQAQENLELHFCGYPEKELWESGLSRSKVWVFDDMQSSLVCGRSLLNEVVASGVPIAIWYRETKCDWAADTSRFVQLFSDRAHVPKKILEHRISHYRINPSRDVVLLYEDPNVPVRAASELENTDLEATI